MSDTTSRLPAGFLVVSALSISLLHGSSEPPPDCSQVPSVASIQKSLEEGDYDGLEMLASRSRDCRAETSDGLRALDAFYIRVVDLKESVSEDSRHKELIRHFEKWKKLKPQSPTPHVALAKTYSSYAWKGRGRGDSSTVTEKGWRLFKERMTLAQAELSHESVSKDPQAYVEMIKVAMAGFRPEGQGAKETAYALFQKGIQVDPDYFPLYYEMSTCLLEQWNGAPGEWEAFAKEYADKRGGLDGRVLYSRILWEKSHWFWHWDFLRRIKVPWDELKTMLDAIAQQRPDSVVEKNLYCYFATLGLDFKTASGLFDWIEERRQENEKVNARRASWVWENPDGGDDYDDYRRAARAKRQAIFEMNLEPLVASKGLLTFTVTVKGPDGLVKPDLGYHRSSTVGDFLLAKSVQKHTRMLEIPDKYGPGRYLVTMVARNNATGGELSWTQEVGEAK